MEVIGSVSALISVLQLTAFVINATTQYIRTAKSADKAAEKLRKQLKAFRGILEELEEHAGDEKELGGKSAEMRFLRNVNETMTECRALLLKIQAKVQEPADTSKLKHAILWPFREKEVDKYIEELKRFTASFQLALNLDNTITVKDIWAEVHGMSASQRDNARSKAIKWLETVDTRSNYILAQQKRHVATGTWFLEGKAFRAWRDRPGSLLWLHGIPGCGKTVLSSSIIDDLEEYISYSKEDTAAVTFFYFDYNDPDKRSAAGLLSCAIAQLCRRLQTLPPAVQTLYAKCDSQDQHGPAPVDTMLEVLFDIQHNWTHIYVVIDALDECPLWSRKDVLTLAEELVSSGSDVRMLITSRPERDIEETMTTLAHQSIMIPSDKVDADVRRYVEHVLKTDIKMKKWPLSDKQMVEATLVEKAGGMFRWVFCQLETLRKCMSRTSVHKTLQALPRTLDSTYERIILSIEEEYRYQAIVALHWLSCTRRPLKLLELAEAVAVRDSADESMYLFNSEDRLFRPSLVLEICSSLVSSSGIEASSDVRLAHFTVQEYLLSQRIQTSPAAAFSVTLAKGNSIMATFCISYMLATAKNQEGDSPTGDAGDKTVSGTFEDKFTEEDFLSDDVLLKYSTEYWYQHANSLTQHPPELSAMILQLLSNNPDSFSVADWWGYAAKYHLGIRYDVSQLEDFGGSVGIASYLGLVPEVKVLLELDLGVSNAARNLDTALHAAAYGGHLDVLEMALDKGANPNSCGGALEYPLHAAAYRGDIAIINALLSRGADANLQGGRYGTALQAAAQGGKRHVCELLLAKGSDPNVGVGLGSFGSPLQAAAYRVDREMTELLLDRGADPNALGGKYGTAIQAAAYRSCKSIVDLLMKRGADPNLQGGKYGTALQAATHWGNIDIIQSLLDAGADPDAQTGKYQYGTALQAAANWGYLDIVELLLDREADPNSEAGMYGSALDAAIIRKDTEMCKILLQRGATVVVEDEENQALINAAVAEEHYDKAVGLLLSSSLDSDAEIGCYGKAVQLAAFKGYKEALQMVKRKKDDTSLYGLSPKHYSTLMLRHNLAQIIPEPLPSSTRDFSSPFTVLHWAAWQNHAEIVAAYTRQDWTKPLLRRTMTEDLRFRTNTSREDEHVPISALVRRENPISESDPFQAAVIDWSPLHLAIYRNHQQVVQALCTLNQEGLPLGMTASLGMRKTCVEILDKETSWEGEPPMACLDDSLGWTPVHIAALLGNTVLLRHWDTYLPDFDIDVQDANGMTALHWVCAAGRKTATELLVSCAADSDAKDRWGRTPVDLVAGEYSDKILDRLTQGQVSALPNNTILARGINCPCWRSCDSCDTLFQHGDLFLHCELCNDLDLCERCLLRERGCKNANHEPGVWAIHNRMDSVSKEFRSLEDLLDARAIPGRHSVDNAVKGMAS